MAARLGPVDSMYVTGTQLLLRFVAAAYERRALGIASFVALLVDYLRMVVDRQGGLDLDQERLGLAVAAPHTGAGEVAQLESPARRQPDDAAFRRTVAAPRATNAKVGP